jgi:D-hexose-6-phosphate mutarotase
MNEMTTLDELNRRFGGVEGVRFCPSAELYPHLEGSLPVLVAENRLGRMAMTPYGAHILSFRPAGGADMLWLSPLCRMIAGQPIRGGIPLCMPWFGLHPQGLPQHGFARITDWSLDRVESLPDGGTALSLSLSDSEATRHMWPHRFVFRLDVRVGRELTIAISVTNTGDDAMPLAFAFHTYFAVGDVTRTRVTGLGGISYVDRLDAQKRKVQSGDLLVPGEIQRLYFDVPRVQRIESPQANYRIESGMSGALVWNCGDNDRAVPDIGEGNHKTYVCVERLDVEDWSVRVAAGDRYDATMTLAVEP